MNFKNVIQQKELYQDLAIKEKNVIFLGRLARYQYLNMDETINSVLETLEKI